MDGATAFKDSIPANREWLRVFEVRRVLCGCSDGHVYNLIRSGELQAENIAPPGAKRPLYKVKTASLRGFIARRTASVAARVRQ